MSEQAFAHAPVTVLFCWHYLIAEYTTGFCREHLRNSGDLGLGGRWENLFYLQTLIFLYSDLFRVTLYQV